ncbi:unnamed protein product [Closterium sp. NIES-65]|nr:unnamed protein product [Closterium sp. NIES-65]
MSQLAFSSSRPSLSLLSRPAPFPAPTARHCLLAEIMARRVTAFNVNMILPPPVPAVKALVQLKEAWGMWAGNSNATTACSAWTGITCSPNGLVTALDSKLFPELDPPLSGAIPASISSLAALQYLDLTYIDLVGPIPSLATLTSLTHLTIGLDGSKLTGTLDGLAWLSSLTNLQTLHAFRITPATHAEVPCSYCTTTVASRMPYCPPTTRGLEYLAAFTGDLSSLHILSHLKDLQTL